VFRRRRVPIAVATVVLGLAGATACSSSGSDTTTVADREPPSTTTTIEPGCDSAVAYVDPGAPPEQVDAVGRAIRAVRGVAAIDYLDQQESYATFQRLFADDPEIVQSMAPEELPTSYRVELEGADPEGTITALEELDLPGIYKVDSMCGLIDCDATDPMRRPDPSWCED
jgi:cell division protein FtsX